MAQEFIGFSEDSMIYNRQYVIAADRPTCRICKDVIVGAVRPTIEGNVLEELAGGVFTSAGDLLPDCLQPRSDGRNAITPDQARANFQSPRERLTKAVFGGVLFDHFGHFLLESTARLWPAGELDDVPWLFLTDGRSSVRRYQREFLAILGLGHDQVVVVDDLVAVDELIMPMPAFVYHHWASRSYLRAFRHRSVPDTAGKRPIFLSRSDTSIATTIGELELEDVLRREAWTILAPERLPANEQVALFRSDNIVMGLQGSAMHLGLFGAAGRRVVHLCRGQGYRGYYLLDDLATAEATYLYAMRPHALASKPISGPFLLDLDMTLGFLREHGLISAAPVAMADLGAGVSDRLEEDYVAWWDFTESQIRFHRQIADDGSLVEKNTALEFALRAAERRPGVPKFLAHALALTIKIRGVEAAAELLVRTGQDRLPFDQLSDPALPYLISMISDASGDYDTAIAAARRAVELAPRNPTYVNQLATSLYRTDRLDEAEAVLRGLVKTDDAASENFFMMSLVALRRAASEEALEWALRAFRNDRANAPFGLHAVDLLASLLRHEEALEICRELLRHYPDDVKLLRRAAGFELALARPRPALDYLLTAYRSGPDLPDLRAECVQLLMADGLLPDLARSNRPSQAECEQSIMIYKQSRSLLASASPDAAVRAAVRSLNLFPRNPEITQHLLGAMLAARRVLETHLLAVLLIDAGLGSGRIHYVLSLAEHELGRPGPARQAAAAAMALEPDNEFIRDHHGRLLAAA